MTRTQQLQDRLTPLLPKDSQRLGRQLSNANRADANRADSSATP